MYNNPVLYETSHHRPGKTIVFSQKNDTDSNYFPFSFSENETDIYYGDYPSEHETPYCKTKFLTDLFLDDIWEQQLIPDTSKHYITPLDDEEPNAYAVCGEITEIYSDFSASIYVKSSDAFIRVDVGMVRNTCRIGNCICSKGYFYIETEKGSIDILPNDLNDYECTEVIIVDYQKDWDEYDGWFSFYPVDYPGHVFRADMLTARIPPQIEPGACIKIELSDMYVAQLKRVSSDKGTYLSQIGWQYCKGIGTVFRIEEGAFYVHSDGMKIALSPETIHEGNKLCIGDKVYFEFEMTAEIYDSVSDE